MTARVALTVAGSDPSGGAGIQGDLKTFSALRTYGTAVIAGLTAQSTRGVTGVLTVPAAFVEQQLLTLLADVAVHGTKTGMLPDAGVVEVVAATLAHRLAGPLVVDPVMVATSGDRLADDDAVAALREVLVPAADLITPNVPEAAALLRTAPARDEADLRAQAQALLDLGPGAVLLKGGHLAGGESVDVLATADAVRVVRRPRVATTACHGTGCLLSAALAALAARAGGEPDWPVLVEQARDVLHASLVGAAALQVGHGAGPVHHLAGVWPG